MIICVQQIDTFLEEIHCIKILIEGHERHITLLEERSSQYEISVD
jgi:hypothetical protein